MTYKRGLILLLLATSLLGQSNANKGNISGLVRDSTGNPLAEAIVVALNTGTGAQREAHTNDSGYYLFGSIDAGAYDFKVDAPSGSVELKDVVVNAGGWVEVDVRMALNNPSGMA